MTVEPRIAQGNWETLDVACLATQAVTAALEACALDPEECVVAVLATDDDGVAALNGIHRGTSAPTNVLSWPAQDLAPKVDGDRPRPPVADPFGDIELGDIALAYQTCAREAREQGKTLSDHVRHLVVHGTLHLLGYDHVREEDAQLMETTETEILGKMGVDDPYRA